ncbi:hypothetical protein DBR32_03335 [Taibaiella sp. KBW10]|uniref:hypothetical protein n=1 Tax=Taibaiella sp. KBW10 TaxID=2153357 RepID=UPI000F5B1E01|nr:hypothetical protein [Taibaiella sp. KBW10]RQO32639.1 hypothetical protein DBR32_03335 [Taibaiella sp. KBW10]
MKRIALLTGLTIVGFNVSAQKNHIDISATPKIWLNSLDVYRDNFGEKSLSSLNRMGYTADLTYRRTTKGRWYYGVGGGYSRYSQKLRLKYDNMGFYIPGTSNYHSVGHYTASMDMLSAQAFVGYSIPIKQNNKVKATLDIDFGVRTMFSLQGEQYVTDTLRVKGDHRYDYGVLEWGLDNFAPVFDLNITYRIYSQKLSRSFFVGLCLSGYPGFHYPIINDNYVNGFSRLGDYKNDLNGNRQYGNPGEIYGEGTFPKYCSIGIRLGVELFKF